MYIPRISGVTSYRITSLFLRCLPWGRDDNLAILEILRYVFLLAMSEVVPNRELYYELIEHKSV